MQLGIFAKIFARETVEQVLGAVAEHGFGCAQFNFCCAGLPSLPARVEPQLIDRIRRASGEHGVGIVAVSGTFNMIHPDVNLRAGNLRRLDVIAGSSAQLGSRVVTLCTGTRDPKDLWRRHPDNDSADAWRDLIAALEGALSIAEKHGVTLAFEPETGNVVDSAQKARRLLDELKSPRLKIVLDPANLLRTADRSRMKAIIEQAFDLLSPDIALAHGKEVNQEGRVGDAAIGSGVLDWEMYLSHLHRAKFTGPLILHGLKECHVKTSVAFLHKKGVFS